jgi:hypothetical protein
MATTLVDLYQDEETRQAIHAEWLEDKAGREYRSFLAEGPPPIPQR